MCKKCAELEPYKRDFGGSGFYTSLFKEMDFPGISDGKF